MQSWVDLKMLKFFYERFLKFWVWNHKVPTVYPREKKILNHRIFTLNLHSQQPCNQNLIENALEEKKSSDIEKQSNSDDQCGFKNKKKLKALEIHNGELNGKKSLPCFCFWEPATEGKPSIRRLLIKCQLIFNFIATKCLKCFNINYILSLLIPPF